jgi:eukaryotic-like serine/threonine-protein kinase
VNYASPAQQLVGAVLNTRWRLIRLLGEGGMGAVFEADGTRGEGKRAIKLLHQEFVKEQQILARFFSEAQATKNLQHPNITQVYDAATAEDGTPYIVMELLVGIPVSAYIEKGRGVPPQQGAPIIHGVLQALSLAHSHGIVHRDLKPDNLFLVRDARGQYVVKVLDFGIAKVMDAAGGMGSKTRTGVLLGTPGYMSPEQIKNSKGVDPRSDLWSIGVIFYEMLTGGPPFPADNEFARLTAVLTEEVKPIERANPALAPWNQFFHRALAKDVNQRFQSADEMARAVVAIARGSAPASDWQAVSIPGSHAAPATANSPMPPSKPVPTIASVPPSGMPPPAQAGGSVAPPKIASAVPTQASRLKPQGTPTISSGTPTVEVVDAPPQRGGAAWWIVGVVAVVCLGIGFAAGILVAGGV